jgi:hypothetical protein
VSKPRRTDASEAQRVPASSPNPPLPLSPSKPPEKPTTASRSAASERFLVDLATPTRNTLVSATGPEQFFTLTERATPYNKGAATSWASHHPR